MDETLVLVATPEGAALARGGHFAGVSEPAREQTSYAVLQILPPFHAWDWGCPSFKKSWGLRYAYVMGSMARGISSLEMVHAAAHGGMLGFFGAAGMMPQEVAHWVDRANREIAPRPFGFNLIHSPFDAELESRVADIYLTAGIDRVEASAFMGMTPALVRYRLSGIHTDPSGTIVCSNRVMAKISREEVAQKFLSPPPEKILVQLVATGAISRRQAELARHVPMCDAITAEADSGGHTDNRPAIALFPTIVALRDRMMAQHGYDRAIPVGLAGGIGTPHAVAAAFAMGADYIQTGSINQSCVESGVAPEIRKLLCETRQADVAMAPSADMFEMGVKVQVLKRGTWFAQKAQKLYDLYARYEGLDALPEAARQSLEKDFFGKSIEEEWESTRAFFEKRKPDEIRRAERDPKHRMALLFRSYLGQSSLWAKHAAPERRMDYQIWCGPAMGAFNAWAAGTPFENPENRKVVDVALRLLNDAAVLQRMQWARAALQQAIRHDPAGHFGPGFASQPLGGMQDAVCNRTGAMP
ncbi:PfaD family polyunsaturated fatty acid/polyketide biosynthesis protein [Desulfatirhabdium butyrativorans]|uniref:PfaD family polyunsaturated fatty acid/polyketide biosynthesis protein n=1 Tax=Desulfatirhabdium butyrativorans TaxID=340467 RepID=UPI000687D2EE|nr:PfaD family polyunsaturated fatty acid/polyketide biosynthesis protein [Desulfatirhabdium butyrativorans]